MKELVESNKRLLEDVTEKWKRVYEKLSGETCDFSEILLMSEFNAKDSRNQKKMGELKNLLFRLELNSIVLGDESKDDIENQNKELEEIKQKLENM